MAEPSKKKRKLPSLDTSFDSPVRATDAPELHQGRKRTVAHERGQWASHVYLELELSTAFRRTLKDSVDLSAVLSSSSPSQDDSATPTIHSLLEPSSVPNSIAATASSDALGAPTPSSIGKSSSLATEASTETLHLSLSRPLLLQTNQRADLRAAVAKVAKGSRGFSARYATFGVLENDEKTRRFLGIEIGTGYDEMHALTRRLDSLLSNLRLPVYYDNPRFHTSLAWSATTSTSSLTESALPFSDSTLEALEKQHGKRLRAEDLYVAELCVKIGKEVTRFALSG